jgi:hypothetical protein
MKRQHTRIAAAVAALLIVGPAWAGKGPGNQAQSANDAGTCPRCAAQVVVGTLDQGETASLVFMREEEKMARDLYLGFGEQWPLPLFANIARSEQRHLDAVGRLLAKYGVTDPLLEDVQGMFVNPDLQALFDELAARGAGSLAEALQVGALVEEVDIADLVAAIAETDDADVAGVYEHLLRGSRNHLRAFVREIERQGEVYVAQHLEQAAVDEILDSPTERGGDGNGRNGGNGHGGNGRGGRGR